MARIFEALGIPVYYADTVAKKVMEHDPELKRQLTHHFGEQVFENGQLNRSYLSAQVFNNPQKLELLNSLVHPVTLKDAERWMQKQSAPYAVKEAALIFESGAQEFLDYVIGVTAPEVLRMHRVMQRDGLSKEAIRGRMQYQLSDSLKMKLCDFVITNDEQQPLIPQVLRLHEHLLSLISRKP